MAQDDTIPTPLSSGATDNPDAPQSGAVAPPPLPAGYQRAGQVSTPPPLPAGYQRAIKAPHVAPTTPKSVTAPALQQKDENTLYSVVDAAKRYGSGLVNSLGLPESGAEYKAAAEEASKLNPTNVAEAVGGPVVSIGKQLWATGKGIVKGIQSTGKEAYEAGQNIAEGQPVLPNLAKPASEALNTAVGAVPFIGAPTVQAGKDITAKNYAHAAGELTGVIGQVVAPDLLEKTHPEQTAKFHDTKVVEAQKELNVANDKAEPYRDSATHGVLPPKEIQSAIGKAQAKLDEATFHRDAHREAMEKRAGTPTSKPAPTPEVSTEEITAKPELGKLGEKKSLYPQLGEPQTPPTVSPAHSTTTVPQVPTEAPKPSYGRIALPNEQGTMGAPKQLTEGTPEGPQVPKGGLPKINLPEEKTTFAVAPKPVVDETALRALKANGKGGVEEDIGKKIHGLLKESLKTDKGTNQNFPSAKVEEAPAEKRGGERRVTEEPHAGEERRQSERRVLQGINERTFQEGAFGKGEAKGIDTDAYAAATEQARKELGPDASKKAVIARRNELVAPGAKGAAGDIGAQSREANPEPTRAETKPVLPKEEPTQYAAKKEEVVPAGSEGREPVKSAAEYHPAVKQKVSELSDANLRQLAKAHGLNPDEYDFNARDERRHRTERDQLTEDIAQQMGEDEKINLGRAAEATEKQGLFQGADTSAKGRAARAEKMFPRLRGVVDEAGNPKISGGSQAVDEEEKTTGFSQKADKRYPATSTVGGVETVATAKSDNEHFANAKKELGPNASISDVAKRAQELKDAANGKKETHKTTGFQPVDKEEYFKAVKANPHAVSLTPPEDMPNNKAYTNGNGVYYSIDPKGDIQALVNNSPSVGAITSAMRDAISKGGKTLDAWDVSLPKFYAKLGFENTEHVPYDEETYGPPSDALQDVWKKQGWKGEQPYPGVQHMKVTDAALEKYGPKEQAVNAKGSPIDEFGNPTVSGGAPEKKLPTGDELIKKYGESNGDPKGTVFILNDGRSVANTGLDHDVMLGGKATDKAPPRERFIAEGNIRVRPHQGASGREVSFSIPESGVNAKQLSAIQKMSPQLRSGGVLIEVGKPGGKYEVIPHGEATNERIEQSIRKISSVINDKGSPTDQYGNPTVSGGSPAAGTAPAKLPKLAEEHLTDEEKAGILKTPRTTEKFVEKMSSLPKVKEFVDAAVGGQGARKWYQRSRSAIEAITKEAPEYFAEPEDLDKFTGLLASSSPRQSVAMNIREALNAWKEYVDADRPEGKDLEKLLRDNFTNKGGKVPNAMKAMEGKPMWPDLTKNQFFKVPSFRDNLLGTLHRVTNDGWMALFSGLDPRELGDPDSYHPISVLTREAAKQLNWEPAEAQAAIWSFVKTFKERGGETSPEQIRHLSEDMADIVRYDPETRSLLSQLKVNLDQLDRRIESNTGEKPEVTRRPSSSSENSARKLSARIKDARGEAPTPKDSGLFDLKPEHDEATRFEPSEFRNEGAGLEKLGEKKKPGFKQIK
jgi:hypothetical protein